MFFSISKYLSILLLSMLMITTTTQALNNTTFPITDGSLENLGDTNVYPVSVTQAGTYTFYSTYTSDRVDLGGELYDVDTNTSLVSNNNSGSYNNFTLSYALEADKQYELRVYADTRVIGSYILHALHAPATPVAGVKDDFNGDGIADILWRKDNGVNHLWIMSADGSHTYKNLGGKRTDYHLASTGDFNGDGITDILWRRKDGVNHIWYMNADGSHVYKNIGTKSTSYYIVGSGDFNGDGISDICWVRGTKAYIWYMNTDGSHSYKRATGTPMYAELIKYIPSIGDFDGDGISDIFWKVNSRVYLWKMLADGTYSLHHLQNKNATLVVTEDFNRDGILDILWRQDNKTSIWYMHADYTHTYKNIGTKSLDYTVAGTADYNDDGVPDILWRTKTGTNHLWYMDSNGSHNYTNIGSKHTTYSPNQVENPTWVTSRGELKYFILKRRDVTKLNTSLITDMHALFFFLTWFNQDISNWDVSNVTKMSHMFNHAYAFNQDIGDWNVSNVTTMKYMFYVAETFNQDIGNWDVFNVKSMEAMFFVATTFNQNISNWDVSNVAVHYDFSDESALQDDYKPHFSE